MSEHVRGFDIENNFVNIKEFMNSFKSMGFQALNLGKAVDICNAMVACKNSTETSNCTIFLSYTSNMVSCGNREYIKYLVKHKKVDCLITTAGGIEEDFIKCFQPTLIGDFNLSGSTLRSQGLNRIGNLLIPSKNYEIFEDWFMPILNEMHDQQDFEKFIWTPSKIINALGMKINNEDSIYYWAYKNEIPVFCPALTDGALGDMIYFHCIKRSGFIIDIVSDLSDLNNLAKFSPNTGMIILGGGVIKHHVCNANLMRNGADFSVYINTAVEYDGSDSGASPDEAVSWGKIKANSQNVKVFGEASIIFPLLVLGSDLYSNKNV